MARFQIIPTSLVMLLLAVTSLLPLLSLSEAKDILIGGKSDAWKVPSSQADSLNKWAESHRFRIGDSLVLKYDSKKDSVLEVTREAYLNCNVSDPVKEYRDGNTKVKLERAGPYYFISGAEGNCVKGQKIIVVVLSPRTVGVPAPAPSPAELEEGPAVAPTSSATGLILKIRDGLTMVASMGILLCCLF